MHTLYKPPLDFAVLTKIVLTEKHKLGRDIMVTIVFWNKNTEIIDQFIRQTEFNSKTIYEDLVSPLLSLTHDLLFHGQFLYTTNAYGEHCRINTKTFEVEFFKNSNRGFLGYMLGFDEHTLYTANASEALWKVDLNEKAAYLVSAIKEEIHHE